MKKLKPTREQIERDLKRGEEREERRLAGYAKAAKTRASSKDRSK